MLESKWQTKVCVAQSIEFDANGKASLRVVVLCRVCVVVHSLGMVEKEDGEKLTQ